MAARALSAWVAVGAAAAGLSVLSTVPVEAGCHHFTVMASPATVKEGDPVTVTVSRDNQLAPSSVNVSTIDGTAKSGEDYKPFQQAVSFASGTSQTFTLETIDDPEDGAGTETFKLHLSGPAGCAVNMNYILDADVPISIWDPDAGAAGTSTSGGPASPSSSGSGSNGVGTPNTATVAPGPPVGVLVAILGAAGISAGALLLRRRLRRSN